MQIYTNSQHPPRQAETSLEPITEQCLLEKGECCSFHFLSEYNQMNLNSDW